MNQEEWQKQIDFVLRYGALNIWERRFVWDLQELVLHGVIISFKQSCVLRRIYKRTQTEVG